MHWGWYALGLLIVLMLDPLRAMAGWHTVDFFLAYALVVAFIAPPVDARLAGVVTGFVQDLLAVGAPLGPHAFLLGLTAAIVVWPRDAMNRDLWWGRWVLGLAAAAPAQLLGVLYFAWWQGQQAAAGSALLTALLSSLLAALVLSLPAVGRRRRRGMRFS